MLRVQQVDATGQLIAARDARGRDASLPARVGDDEEWFRVALSQYRPFISDVARRPAYGSEPVVGVSAPLLRDGRFAGALRADIPVQAFVRLNAESLARRRLELLVLDRGNRVIHAGRALRWTTLDAGGERGEAIRRAATEPGQATRTVLLDGLLRERGAAYVEAVAMRNGWTLALVAPRSQLLAPLLPRLLLVIGLVAITLLGIVWALWLQRRLLGRSIGYLLGSLRGYALGGRMVSARNDAIPEELRPLADGIGELGTRMNAAFDNLQTALEEREHEIAARTASLREAISELDRLSRTDAMTGCLNYRGFTEAGERLFGEARARARRCPCLPSISTISSATTTSTAMPRATVRCAASPAPCAARCCMPTTSWRVRAARSSPCSCRPPITRRRCRWARASASGCGCGHRAHGLPPGRLTASVGVATLQPGDADLEDMLRRADAALYRVKAAGRDGVSA